MRAGADTQENFIETQQEGESRALILKGDWTVYHASTIEEALTSQLAKKSRQFKAIDAAGITKLDTAGAWLIKKYLSDASLQHLQPRQKALLEFLPDQAKEKKKDKDPHGIRAFFGHIGEKTVSITHFVYEIFAFLGAVFVRFFANFLSPRHFRLPSIARHIHETGIRALPIIGLLAIGVSMVVSYQGAVQLRKFGADIFTVDLTVVSLLREMSVLVTAIMIAGRSGSAFAAEIGVMKLRGEVDALRTMGINPIETLVVPRVLALLITLPLLTFFADAIGLIGSGLMASSQLGISFTQYAARVHDVATPTMFFVGMIKAPVFAFLIATICTYQGMHVSGSAENVGKLTTKAVVQSIFVVMMTDALFSIIFSRLEI